MPRVYIAGPMRSIPHMNFPAFDAAAAKLAALGREVVSPAQMDRDVEGWGQYPPEDLVCNHALRVRCMKRDLLALLDFDPAAGDAIYLLPGWPSSTGARAEYALARFLGLRVMEWMDDMEPGGAA